MDLSELFILQFMMFAEMFAGFLLCKTKVLKPQHRSIFSKAVINLFLPCSIVNSFAANTDANVFQDFLIILLVSLGIQVLCTILAKLLFGKRPEHQKPILHTHRLPSFLQYAASRDCDSETRP